MLFLDKNLSLSFGSLKCDRPKQTVLRQTKATASIPQSLLLTKQAPKISLLVQQAPPTASLLKTKDSFPYPVDGRSLITRTFHQSAPILSFPSPISPR